MVSERRRIVGVDFSGAADAGRKVWVAGGTVGADGVLLLDQCQRGEELPGGGRDRARCLAALVAYLASQGDALAGLDFPFGLPAAWVDAPDWPAFVAAFGGRHADAAAFRAACRARAAGREPRRCTDIEARTPFPVANLRLHRQTFHGIRDVLAPLVVAGAARALPMQPAVPGKPALLEICPASTLKRWGCYWPYKGRTAARAAGRERLLAALATRAPAVRLDAAVAARALADPEGDALDAVLAAITAFHVGQRATPLDRPPHAAALIEGCVYW